MANLKDELRVIGNCPFCGTQLGFGHLPSQCEFNDAKPSTEWIANAAQEAAEEIERVPDIPEGYTTGVTMPDGSVVSMSHKEIVADIIKATFQSAIERNVR